MSDSNCEREGMLPAAQDLGLVNSCVCVRSFERENAPPAACVMFFRDCGVVRALPLKTMSSHLLGRVKGRVSPYLEFTEFDLHLLLHSSCHSHARARE